ncbi:hypothetical protein [Woeseia oceani]|nr:hypothetical protein [Woeseia oceani]
MAADTLAALIWRFIGIALIATALPGVLLLTTGVVASMGSGGQSSGLFAEGAMAMSLLNTLLIVVGLIVISSSKNLGILTARGL